MYSLSHQLLLQTAENNVQMNIERVKRTTCSKAVENGIVQRFAAHILYSFQKLSTMILFCVQIVTPDCGLIQAQQCCSKLLTTMKNEAAKP